MLNKYLDEAVSYLDELINLTKTDIQNIQKADHTKLDEHSRLKNELVNKFEQTKKQIDSELLKIASSSPDADLSSLLSDEVKTRLNLLKQSLNNLKELNKSYAKSVIVVKDFYDSLVNEIFGINSSGYTAKSGKRVSKQFYMAKA